MHQNFPVIDAFYNNTASSIKTIDLTGKIYQNTSKLSYKIKKDIDKLYNFSDTARVKTEVLAIDIVSKELKIGITPNPTAAQIQAINKAIDYGQSKNITVKIYYIDK